MLGGDSGKSHGHQIAVTETSKGVRRHINIINLSSEKERVSFVFLFSTGNKLGLDKY